MPMSTIHQVRHPQYQTHADHSQGDLYQTESLQAPLNHDPVCEEIGQQKHHAWRDEFIKKIIRIAKNE